jgi:hypothetical protein
VKPRGALYLSWRVTDGDSQRDQQGRLYSAFDKRLVLQEMGEGDLVLVDREDVSASSGKWVHRLVVRKAGLGR